MKPRLLPIPLLFAVFVLPAAAVQADETLYRLHVRPLLAEKCASCHGALKQESGLRLDAGQLIHESGFIVPGESSASELVARVTAMDDHDRMPPEHAGEPLTDQQINWLKDWIDAGAQFPATETIPPAPDRHWAYLPPEKVALKGILDAEEIRNSIPAGEHLTNPIDVLIQSELVARELTPSEPADRHTLLRRVHLDLTGLPPTVSEIESFIADPSPDALTRVIDRLLDSPHFGERWGRHWMDVWRYSDWDGYKNMLRGSQRHIWRWRDWIVRSLNEDKPYDQMIVEMLAADETAPLDPDALAATGFLARNYHHSNRNIWLDATIEHSAKAFLGLTLNCARCHDHKYDPVTQQDYFRFRAIFEPHQVRTDRIPGQPNTAKDGIPRAYDAEPQAKTFLFVNGDEKQPDESNPIVAAIPSIFNVNFQPEKIHHPPLAFRPGLRDFELERVTKQLLAKRKKAEQQFIQSVHDPSRFLEFRLAELEWLSFSARLAADQAEFLGAGRDDRLVEAAVDAEAKLDRLKSEFEIGKQNQAIASIQQLPDAERKKQTAELDKLKKQLAESKKRLETLKQRSTSERTYTPIGDVYPSSSTGRRAALARWIASRDNPLTARVAVNQVWMRHFGTPLVDNVFDFGLRSSPPQHQALLDWLAVELMENNWSLKHLHRLILNSRTWQQTSTAPLTSRNLQTDPDNRMYWKMNVRRLEGEIVRDSLLATSGRLDSALGGPDIDFNLGESSLRRSIYLRHAYEKQMTMLVTFDAANPNDCYRRSVSVIPQQALALANSQLTWECAKELADKIDLLTRDSDDPEIKFIELAFVKLLGRPADEFELDSCLDYLRQQRVALAKKPGEEDLDGIKKQEVRQRLIQVLMNHNDFVTVR